MRPAGTASPSAFSTDHQLPAVDGRSVKDIGILYFTAHILQQWKWKFAAMSGV
jgi:hypothetical protein